jgi:pimeloyl-ACP methyl ester carboxylesterase
MFVVALLAFVVLTAICLIAFAALIARAVERAAPPLGQWLDVDGARLHYIDVGQGPTIVMIHGLGGQLRHFTYGVVDRLKNEFRVVVFDRPGSGYSTRPKNASARLRAQGNAIATAMQRLGLQRSLIVGHSMGGGIALAIALDHPECVRGLALIAPLTHVVKTPPPAFASLVIPSPLRRAAFAWTIATPLGLLRGADILAAVFKPDCAPPDFGTKGGAILGLRPYAFLAASADMLESNYDLRDMAKRYNEIAVPVNVLCGREDNILEYPSQALKLKEALPSVDVELIDGGHMPLITNPVRTADFIAKAALGKGR